MMATAPCQSRLKMYWLIQPSRMSQPERVQPWHARRTVLNGHPSTSHLPGWTDLQHRAPEGLRPRIEIDRVAPREGNERTVRRNAARDPLVTDARHLLNELHVPRLIHRRRISSIIASSSGPVIQ